MIAAQLRDQELHYEKIMAQETMRGLDINASLMKEDGALYGDSESFSLLAAMEGLKLEISLLEQENIAGMETLRAEERRAKELRKENEVLLREQQRLKTETAAFSQRATDVKDSLAATVEDLEQQIRDLDFFTRTRESVEASDQKEDLQAGDIVIGSSPAPRSIAGRDGEGSSGDDSRRRRHSSSSSRSQTCASRGGRRRSGG